MSKAEADYWAPGTVHAGGYIVPADMIRLWEASPAEREELIAERDRRRVERDEQRRQAAEREESASPCPFCGGRGIEHADESRWVVCGQCWARTAKADTSEAAWELWNNRKG